MTTLLETPDSWPHVTLAPAREEPLLGLAEAQRAGAWTAWRRAVTELAPEALTDTVARAGLCGRGGAGFPAAQKWRACRAAPGPERYAVANGYEADPGVSIDRTLMERDPHAVVEGLALAAFAAGASSAFLAVKAGYGLALERLRAAVAQAEEAGILGIDALGAGIDLQIEVRPVQGAFILGEETALLRALEGKRGMPDQRPPYPAVRGLFGRPTVVHNVETLAAIPWIVRNGAAAFAEIGREGAHGTKLVQLSGAVRTPGIAEVPMGVPLGEVLETAGGGMAKGSTFKALLVGGPAGGFLPEAVLETPLDFDNLRQAGAIVGSGSLLAVDQRACIVELGRLMERFMSDESCGKCIPCRIGTRRLLEIGDRFTGGRTRPTDPTLLRDLSADVVDGSLCGHGINAPNPLLSGMRYFGEEYDAHISAGTCPAGVCRPLRILASASR